MDRARLSSRRIPHLIAALAVTAGFAVGCASAGHDAPRSAGAAHPGDPIRRDVARLDDEDFRARTAAARRLVDRGILAVPALGEVSDEPPGVARQAVLEQIQMNLSADELDRCLASPHPVVRGTACRVAADRRLAGLVGGMLPLLDDRDGEVRAVALNALRRLTRDYDGASARDFRAAALAAR